jgi:hypothetical protein
MSESLARTLSDTHEDDPPDEYGWDDNLIVLVDAYVWEYAEALDLGQDRPT